MPHISWGTSRRRRSLLGELARDVNAQISNSAVKQLGCKRPSASQPLPDLFVFIKPLMAPISVGLVSQSTVSTYLQHFFAVSLESSCYFLLFLPGNYAACSYALRGRYGQQNNAKHTWPAMGVRFESTQAFLNLFHMLSNIYWEPNRPAIGLHPDKVQI